jgi:hypothetical protein
MAKEEFCIDDFLVNEHDRYGKSLPVYFRVPPFVAHHVDSLLWSGRYPFQTKEELSRWAFCLGVLSLQKIKGLDYSSPLLNLPLVIYRRCSPIGIQEFFIEVHKIIRDLSALGYRTPELQKFIAIIEELIQCLPSKYDREEYLGMLEKRRLDLLESTRWPIHPSRKGYRGR